MRSVNWRGRAGKVLARLALGAALMAVLVVAWGATAVAIPVGQQFVPAQSPVVWPSVSAVGVAENTPVTVDAAEVALGGMLPNSEQLIAGKLYLYVSLH